MDINVEEIIKEDFFSNDKYVPDGDSRDYHSITHKDTEILGMFCDATAIHGEDLKDVLVEGYLRRIVKNTMKNTVMKPKPINYIKTRKDGWLYSHYMYADLEKYVADNIFIKNKLRVDFGKEFVKEIDGEKYIIVFCKFRKNKQDVFIQCMDELNKKMLLCGHTAYEKIKEDIGMIMEGWGTWA